MTGGPMLLLVPFVSGIGCASCRSRDSPIPSARAPCSSCGTCKRSTLLVKPARPLRLVSSLLPSLPCRRPRSRTPSTSSRHSSPRPPSSMRRKGCHRHVGDTQRWNSTGVREKPTPNPIRSIDEQGSGLDRGRPHGLAAAAT
ncbi:hypothetical protein VPH35_028752 [Triticum aestivum]